MIILYACSPSERRVSGSSVIPQRWSGFGRTRGSPVSGASTSSSSATWCARASGSSSSRVGLRPPDSSRDSVLTEMPVVSESCARVVPRSRRSARSLGPTASSTGTEVVGLSRLVVLVVVVGHAHQFAVAATPLVNPARKRGR